MIERILSRLEKVRKSGRGYTARCPAHADRSPSLSIRESGDKILVTCHAGCSAEEIMLSLGLTLKDLFNSNQSPADRAKHKLNVMEDKLGHAELVIGIYIHDIDSKGIDSIDKRKYLEWIRTKHKLQHDINQLKGKYNL